MKLLKGEIQTSNRKKNLVMMLFIFFLVYTMFYYEVFRKKIKKFIKIQRLNFLNLYKIYVKKIFSSKMNNNLIIIIT